jgi:diadenosine tetraphosphate (Ap4A) HIT family hydrolase
MSCSFCEKLRQLDSLPEHELVWRFPASIALLGSWQYYRGYCVLVARKHAKELFDLLDWERRAYFDEMCLLAKAIHSSFRPHKLNYELLGNQVPHLHWHLFPRAQSDPDTLRPVWLALDQAERDEAERRRLLAEEFDRPTAVKRLRDTLQQLAAPTAP